MIRAALLVLLCVSVSSASAAGLEYKEGATFSVVLTSGTRCEVRIVNRQGDTVIVNSVKPNNGCPTTAAILRLGSVTAVKRERSKASAVWRGIAGGALIAFGGLAALSAAIADGPDAGGRAAIGVMAGGMFTGGILVLRGGHHWSVHVGQQHLEPAP